MKHTGSLFPLLLVGVLAALTFWLQTISEGPAGDRSGRHRHDPDFIIDSFSVRSFGSAGTLQNTLSATRMLHYPDDDTTTVIAPRVIFHATPPTQLSAEQALVSKDAKQVRLEKNVRLVRGAESGGLPIEASTERLDVVPDLETASTDTPVTITQGRSVVTGSGLIADNKTRQTTLLGPVRGVIHRDAGKTP
ncbi:LPS export ABC transporter periplasmic protein LptC [Sulfurisoma sediminicola]|uniref:Lipopolysaccharide export system protein LptC n=1 Tax=Sulfurisoma sediminicola TaxID=1381557 RepID=A0A497XBW3_9PROT|nr:LPS export ABC transporter periplasmic protein LptC [Sulfurisoma sediminicola]RLJ63759.1 lipopolysaccharide export system protein LptC [Sulfurisoma sediminicola]